MNESNRRLPGDRASGSTSAALAGPLEAYAQRLRAEIRVVEAQLATLVATPTTEAEQQL